MTSTIYTMASRGRDRGVVGRFTSARIVEFADQMKVDADLAAESVPVEEISAARMERIMRLKAAIEEGSYFVSSRDVAECMMASMLGDGRRKIH